MKNFFFLTIFAVNFCLLIGCGLKSEGDSSSISNAVRPVDKVAELDSYIDTVQFNLKHKAYYEFPNEIYFYKWSEKHHPVYNSDNSLIGFIDSKKDIYYGIQMYTHPSNNHKIYQIQSRATISELISGSFGDNLQLDRIVNLKTKKDHYLLHNGKVDIALDNNSHIDSKLRSVVSLYK